VRVFTIGIDATNLRGGGGVTHLVEVLRAARFDENELVRVIVWSGESTLSALEERSWLVKRNPPPLNKGLLHRTLWQRYRLSQAARAEGCDILFVPGGSYAGNFQPVVCMSQNLLPFEIHELRRYGLTLFALKLLLLRLTQARSFRKADGVIFLTKYAREIVSRVTGKLVNINCVIPHGLNPRFKQAPKSQLSIVNYNAQRPYRLLYVSIIDQYKHQWHVVEAIAKLRKQGLPIVLDLVGPAYPPALQRLNSTLNYFDPERHWVCYHGAIAFDTLHNYYSRADLGIFASSCENMPNILLETMASGLPIACSHHGSILEVLGEAGVYFDPEQSDNIACALLKLILSPKLRTDLALASYILSQKYSWELCSTETFTFFRKVVDLHNRVRIQK
jgi:glycosyltransferase involved in cell wall biosynthesis